MESILAGLLAGIACLLLFWALGLFDTNSVTLNCSNGNKPKVEQVGAQANGYAKVTC